MHLVNLLNKLFRFFGFINNKNENIWLVGCFGHNGPLRQYFRLYRGVYQRERKRGEMIDERNNFQPTPPARAVGPCPTLIQISRTPWHWKFTQHHRTTRPPQNENAKLKYLHFINEIGTDKKQTPKTKLNKEHHESQIMKLRI